ncbi:MAG: family 43 glycosylhydrolase [Clostridia bacterium]|nr:family 43 glycosylhydrolase [Clostridia bacterium]
MKNKFFLSLVCLLATVCLIFALVACEDPAATDTTDYSEEQVADAPLLYYSNNGSVNAADPCVITVGDTFYMYATNAFHNVDCGYIRVWRSKNLDVWEEVGTAFLPNRNAWAVSSLWAPEVVERNGTYYMYYSGYDVAKRRMGIGVATSASPLGPFTELDGVYGGKQYSASVCPFDFGYAVIDPTVYIDDDREVYFYFSQDQYDGQSSIFGCKLKSDMVSVVDGTLKQLIKPSQSWENLNNHNKWNEAPHMLKHGGKYYLTYSANYYMSSLYGIGVAISDSPLGSFVKPDYNPVLQADPDWTFVSGTGHNSIFPSPDGTELWMAYHSHIDVEKGGSERKICFDKIAFDKSGRLIVDGPSITRQTTPSGCSVYKNVAPYSTVNVGGDKLIDGIINYHYDDVDTYECAVKANESVTFKLDKTYTVCAVMVYDSADYALSGGSFRLTVGEKTLNVRFPAEYRYLDATGFETKIPGTAAVSRFNDVTTDTVTIEFKNDIDLNEVMILAKEVSAGSDPQLIEPTAPDDGIVLDSGSAIDGVKDAFYGDKSISFTETNSGITVTTWAHIGTNGLYLYSFVDDPSVYYSSEKQFYENDSVEYYIDADPEKSFSLSALNSTSQTRIDCVQVRINALGESQTWCGRYTGYGAYPWVQASFPVRTAAKVNGDINVSGGATSYSIEAFIPWSAMMLDSAPSKVGVMPAFNNVDNREDTSRSWFTVKGMSHGLPTGYAAVYADGFADIGLNYTPEKALACNADDPAYIGPTVEMYEVNENNLEPETRASAKAVLKNDGVYMLFEINDKVLTNGSDNIWNNDGIEVIFDTLGVGGYDGFVDGIVRIGVDVDCGFETDNCKSGHNDYYPVQSAAFVNVKISDFEGESVYDYKYRYVIELMVPYSTLGLTSAPESINFAWAVKSPNERVYILNRRNGAGVQEGQDWLWTDKHFPRNPSEYYTLSAEGIKLFCFPEWTDWNDLTIRSDAPDRLDYRGFAADDGLYLNIVQYLDNIVTTGDKWNDQTHIELEIWQGNFGYGWDGTYFAFFIDNGEYINNSYNVKKFIHEVTLTDRGEGFAGRRYMINYEIYIGFDNNLNAADGPYAYVQIMSYAPGDGIDGYEKLKTVTKDGVRTLWTENCNSIVFHFGGADEKEGYFVPPLWQDWENVAVRSDAPSRYDYRGFAAADGFYINFVQYVDNVVTTGDKWNDQTHFEMEIWQGDIGYGWDGTYFAFFINGSDYYINNARNVTNIASSVKIIDRGENFVGHRYMISYEVYIGFVNNAANPSDGPYAYAQLMSYAPGESTGDYGFAKTIVKDGRRTLWTDNCDSTEFRASGAVGKENN